GDRGRGGEGLRGGGARGRRSGSGGSGRGGLGRSAGERGAEDGAAEHGRSAEATRRAPRGLGGGLGATGETGGGVRGHDGGVVPSEPDLWPGMCCLQFGATGS